MLLSAESLLAAAQLIPAKDPLKGEALYDAWYAVSMRAGIREVSLLDSNNKYLAGCYLRACSMEHRLND